MNKRQREQALAYAGHDTIGLPALALEAWDSWNPDNPLSMRLCDSLATYLVMTGRAPAHMMGTWDDDGPYLDAYYTLKYYLRDNGLD